jgi:hypothetical protein
VLRAGGGPWFDINAPSLFAPFLPRKHELAFNAWCLLGNRRFSDPGASSRLRFHGSLVGLDRKRHGLWTKDAKYVEGAANVLPTLVKLAPRNSDELVKNLN